MDPARASCENHVILTTGNCASMTELPEIDHLEGRESWRLINMRNGNKAADLRELLRRIWRRRRVVVGMVVTVTALVAIISFQLVPRYTARAQVMIEPRRSQVVDVQAVLSGLPPDTETINSEIQVIHSRQMASRVIERLGLDSDPEFNPDLREPTWWSAIADYEQWLPAELLGAMRPQSPEDQAELAATRVIDTFLRKLSVQAKLRSWVIEVSVETTDARRSAEIANAVVDLYLVEQLEAKFEATKVATEWLSERLSGLREQVEISERAVAEYRRQVGLVEGKDSVDVTSQQLSEINTQLVLASSERAEAEARLQQVERLVRSRRDVSAVAQVLASPLIQRLHEQESELIRREGELSSEYGPKHPRMINLRAEIRDLRRKISGEVDKIIQGLKGEVDVAKARERSLRSNLGSLESKIGDLNQKQVQLSALQRDANANRALYEAFLARFKEMSGQQELQTPDARIISRAGVPTIPSYPNKTVLVVFAFVGSLVLGLVVVFAIEQLDAGFRSMEQIEQITRFPALGLIPHIRTARNSPPERMVLDDPVSAYAESIRNLFVSLMLSNVDKPPKLVLVSSSMPEEGKSAISLSLARTVALSGRKVVVVDCDLRRPRVHDSLGMPRTPGLVELLAHRASAEDVIRKDNASGLHVISAGEHVSNTTDLVGSEQMKLLLTNLAKSYDLVVMDSPPVLAVTDARILSTYADKTVFVVRWEKTRREAAILGLRQLSAAGASIAGVVLSKVDVKKHAGYGYADSGYYYGKYKKYYTT